MPMKKEVTARDRAVVALCRSGSSIGVIAKKLGITRQRVSAIIQKFRSLTGETVERPIMEDLTSVAVLARSLGVANLTVFNAKKALGLTGRLKVADCAAVRAKIRKECDVCRGEMIVRAGQKRFCSPKCRLIGAALTRTGVLGMARTHERTARIAELLATVPAGEQYLPLRFVEEASGLSKMQLWWLGRRKIIATMDSNVLHFSTNKPIKLYSMAHARAVGQMLADVGGCNATRSRSGERRVTARR